MDERSDKDKADDLALCIINTREGYEWRKSAGGRALRGNIVVATEFVGFAWRGAIAYETQFGKTFTPHIVLMAAAQLMDYYMEHAAELVSTR